MIYIKFSTMNDDASNERMLVPHKYIWTHCKIFNGIWNQSEMRGKSVWTNEYFISLIDLSVKDGKTQASDNQGLIYNKEKTTLEISIDYRQQQKIAGERILMKTSVYQKLYFSAQKITFLHSNT